MARRKGYKKIEITTALEDIVMVNQPYIAMQAKQLKESLNTRVCYDDLVQVGNEILIKVVIKARERNWNYEFFQTAINSYVKKGMLSYALKMPEEKWEEWPHQESLSLEEIYLKKQEWQELITTIKQILNAREYYILMERYVVNAKQRTYEDLAKDLNLSHERVRQIENLALTKLKEHELMQKFSPQGENEIAFTKISSDILQSDPTTNYQRIKLKKQKEEILKSGFKNNILEYFYNIYGYSISKKDLSEIINNTLFYKEYENLEELKIAITIEINNYFKLRHDNIVKKRKIV